MNIQCTFTMYDLCNEHTLSLTGLILLHLKLILNGKIMSMYKFHN